ncbi:MAG: ABC transporter permease subunit [Clostridia bacterium]|nr:ABC transporter permease subunit [Clostridia bacterium]
MKAIFNREFNAYFKTPLGYIFVGLFFAFCALMFFNFNMNSNTSIMTNYFTNICYVFIVIVPLLTMKMFSEERKLKTDQLLLTAPVKVTDIVLGKFLSGLLVLGISVALTLIFLIVLAIYGNPPVIQSLVGYFGIILYGAMLIAIGMFVSTLTQNQVISAVITMAIVGVLSLFSAINFDFTTALGGKLVFLGRFLNGAVNFIDINARFYDFAQGILNVVPIVYYVSITALFVLLTVRVIERRRWR